MGQEAGQPMKAHLLYRDRDLDMAQALPSGSGALVQDLELETLFGAMAQGDKAVAAVVRQAVLTSLADVETILYRQDILKDCLRWEAVVRDMYALLIETIEVERKNYIGFGFHYPAGMLHRSVDVLQMFFGVLQKLRGFAEQNVDRFESEGLRALFAMLIAELSDDYLATIRQHLQRLKFRGGILVSARLGKGNEGEGYVLRKENAPDNSWIERLLSPRPPAYSFRLPERDEGGARALSELRDRGITLVAGATFQAAHHITSFIKMLRTELAFYIGCLNLRRLLTALDEPVCFPVPHTASERDHRATGLYDVCLGLSMARKITGNTVDAKGKDVMIITGANQGGKSTFLRSIGLSQVMMQCGMFVPAESFAANVCERIFTHYRREEDATMSSGKFDEELSRMNDIAAEVRPNSIVLFNESFASTNEREGSEIARQVVTALMERHIKVFFVTHQYEFAHGLHARNLPNTLFLRAERQEGGTRTFRICEGVPLVTSYGQDLYAEIFVGQETARVAVAR